VIHTLSDFPTTIGNNVTIGHRAIVHGAHIEDNVIVGIGSIIGSYAQVRKGAVIGEGAVVSQKKEIPARSIAMGMPAKIIKTITEEQEMNAIKIADYYVKSGRNRARYLKEIKI
jgi:carbonic anhydrase/acetyltransferase-like protein (isoleucine patch superfamily)